MISTSMRLPVVFLVAFSLSVAASYAQDKKETPGMGEIRSVLLRPGGWAVEYRGPTGDGVSEFVFEERGDKIVVKISSSTINMKCERNAELVGNTVKMDACYSTGITLRYEPSDSEYPFKGENETVAYKLKPK